ncbi:3-dehydroquinate synthase [subsurface metagenome]
MKSIQIKSGQGDYAVDFFDDVGSIWRALESLPKCVALIDRNVLELYADSLRSLTDLIPVLVIDATEEEKTLVGISRCIDFFQKNDCTKQSVVIAIGGGIIQDIATFSSHLYYRGIKWIMVPTTLLSMADSCIGAKCGINFNVHKNQLGVFNSPSKILLCSKFVETLSDDDVRSGYGEILKLSLTGERDFYDFLKESVSNFGFRNDHLPELIYRSLKVKKKVIELDEYESDLRRILNYGHTFGHSLESLTEYEVSHGAGVAWGLDLVNLISLRKDLLCEEDFCNIHNFVKQYFPIRTSVAILSDKLIDGTRRDKKNRDGRLNLVLLEKSGKLIIEPIEFDSWLNSVVSDYLRDYQCVL